MTKTKKQKKTTLVLELGRGSGTISQAQAVKQHMLCHSEHEQNRFNKYPKPDFWMTFVDIYI